MWIINEFGELVWMSSARSNRAQRIVSRVNMKDGEGEGGGGDNGDGGENQNQETEAQKIQKAVDAATAKLKLQNDTLINEKRSLSATQKLIEDIGGVDSLNSLKEFKSKIEQDEILKLALDGKPQEAIDKATERLKLDHNAEKNKLIEDLKAVSSEKEVYVEKVRKLVVDSSVSTEFLSSKGLDTALADVLARAASVFVVEDDKAVPRNADGSLMVNSNGGPMNVKDWIENLKKTAPHLFPSSSGVNMANGNDNSDVSTFAQLLVEAAKKGPDELRKEKLRQAEVKKKAAAK